MYGKVNIILVHYAIYVIFIALILKIYEKINIVFVHNALYITFILFILKIHDIYIYF